MARWICSDDPIPEGHIRLSQAFDLSPNWQGLDAAINEPMASPWSARGNCAAEVLAACCGKA